MIIYELDTDEASQKRFVGTEDMSLVLTGKNKHNFLDLFGCRGDKKADRWPDPPPGIRWFDDDGRNLNKYKDPDISYVTVGGYVLSPRAAELLRPIISDVAELLPLPFQGETWYFMNVFNHIDVVDKANSRYKIYSNGKTGYLIRPGFFADKVPHAKLFTTPYTSPAIYYAEHRPDDNPNTFKNVIERNKLFGIKFHKVWEG